MIFQIKFRFTAGFWCRCFSALHTDFSGWSSSYYHYIIISKGWSSSGSFLNWGNFKQQFTHSTPRSPMKNYLTPTALTFVKARRRNNDSQIYWNIFSSSKVFVNSEPQGTAAKKITGLFGNFSQMADPHPFGNPSFKKVGLFLTMLVFLNFRLILGLFLVQQKFLELGRPPPHVGKNCC